MKKPISQLLTTNKLSDSRFSSFHNIQEALLEGTLNCESIVDHYLHNIAQQPELNAFLEVYEEEARAQARKVDEKIKAGHAGRLAGMVVGLKDVLCYKDHGLQAGSKILDQFQSQFNGTAVQRLLDEDVIVIGRQNCDEFAMGSSNENSAFGPVKNALDPERVPGGSSGGSAVAVQADMCLVSLGSDTGGSVRQPAAFTGIIGLKPTYSRISRYGLIAYASSFDTIGVLARDIEDCALVMEVIAGSDKNDSTVSSQPVPEYSRHLQLDKKARVAYITDTLNNEGLNAEIKEATEKIIGQLQQNGHTVEPISFPLLDYLLPAYYILTTAEASSNLSRFDGVRYGYRSDKAGNLEEMYKLTREEGFGEEVKRRIMLGTFVLSASYYDAYYTKASKVRKLLIDRTREIFRDYDYIIMPTTPTTAFKMGEHSNPLEMYLADLFTVHASLVGIPAISIPAGNDKQGLPIGIQLYGDYFNEAGLMGLSNEILNYS